MKGGSEKRRQVIEEAVGTAIGNGEDRTVVMRGCLDDSQLERDRTIVGRAPGRVVTDRPDNTLHRPGAQADHGARGVARMPREGDMGCGTHLSNAEMIELGSVGERIAELEQGMTLLAEELAALRLKFRLGLIDAGDSAQGNVGPGPADYWETVELGVDGSRASRLRGVWTCLDPGRSIWGKVGCGLEGSAGLAVEWTGHNSWVSSRDLTGSCPPRRSTGWFHPGE